MVPRHRLNSVQYTVWDRAFSTDAYNRPIERSSRPDGSSAVVVANHTRALPEVLLPRSSVRRVVSRVEAHLRAGACLAPLRRPGWRRIRLDHTRHDEPQHAFLHLPYDHGES